MSHAGPAKGVLATIRRAVLISRRYGVSPSRMHSRLEEFSGFLEQWGVTATIPVTGIVLRRHPEFSRALGEFDVAVHGYRHVPYSSLSPAELARDLDAAMQVFRSNGFEPRGFRAPYLRSNRDVHRVLSKYGLVYDSSSPRFDLLPGHPTYSSALALAMLRYDGEVTHLHRPQNPGPPLEIPVSLPDDEILIDGLGISRVSVLSSVYENMLERTRETGDLLVLQIHPERFRLCRDALGNLLEDAVDDGAWMATLSEVAKWKLSDGGPELGQADARTRL